MDEKKSKSGSTGRPKGSGTSSAANKILRVIITPRQERLLDQIRREWGMSPSETTRRALDNFLDAQIEKGELVDSGPAAVGKTAEPMKTDGD